MFRTVRRLAVLAAASALAATALSAPAGADPQTIPNGPWLQDSQHVSLNRLHSNAELVKALKQVERSSGGRVSLETVGKSNEGRDLWLAKAGTGPVRMLFVTQQHGNEPLGTEAALQLLQRLGNGGAGWDAILQKVTLLVVPRVNPDGAERFRRQNFDPDCSGAFCTPGAGFDINRWHDPAVAPEDNPVPEAAAVQRVYERFRPQMVVDLHHQGSYVNGDGELIKTSIFWPNAAGVPSGALNLSKQMCVVTYDTLGHYGFAEVSQYPGTLPNGISRNAYGLRGSGSILIEMRGDVGQKSAGMLTRTFFVAMGSLMEAAAEDTFGGLDPTRADAIPLRGDDVDNPNEE